MKDGRGPLQRGRGGSLYGPGGISVVPLSEKQGSWWEDECDCSSSPSPCRIALMGLGPPRLRALERWAGSRSMVGVAWSHTGRRGGSSWTITTCSTTRGQTYVPRVKFVCVWGGCRDEITEVFSFITAGVHLFGSTHTSMHT